MTTNESLTIGRQVMRALFHFRNGGGNPELNTKLRSLLVESGPQRNIDLFRLFNGVAHTPFRCVLSQYRINSTSSDNGIVTTDYKLWVGVLLTPSHSLVQEQVQNLVEAFCETMDENHNGEIVAEEHNALRDMLGLGESYQCITNKLQFLPSLSSMVQHPQAQETRDTLAFLFRTQNTDGTVGEPLYGQAPDFDYMNFLYGNT
jgi:hypothetical protein